MKRESNAEGSPVGSPGSAGLGPRPVRCKPARRRGSRGEPAARQLFVEGQRPGLTDQDRQDIDEWLETSLAANLQAKEEDWGVLFRHEPAEGLYRVTGRLDGAEARPSHSCDNGSVAPTLGLPLPDSQYFPSPATAIGISTISTPLPEAAASPSSHQGREEADAETTRSRQP